MPPDQADAMIVPEGWDDEALLAALRQAFRARRGVPPDFVEAGRNAFAWHNIDTELAQLTYDSARDTDRAPSTRSEAASIRALTFTSALLTIELEVSRDSLLGQIVPVQAAMIGIQTRAGSEQRSPLTRSATSRSAPFRLSHSGCIAGPPPTSTSSPDGSLCDRALHAHVNRAPAAESARA